MRNKNGSIRTRSWLVRAGLALAGAFVISSIAIPAAYAAEIQYSNNLMTSEGTARSSGLKSTISGGKVILTLGVGSQTIITYSPAPGYNEYGRSTTLTPSTGRLSHLPASNVYSRCYWWADGVGGSAEISCWYRS